MTSTILQQNSIAEVIDELVIPPPATEGETEDERGIFTRSLTEGILSLAKGGKEFKLRLSDLPADAVAMFRAVEICDAGTFKTAYVLMTEPVEV